jgi:2,3-bisphosphoglycerate-dependent phosphoglycerate mutase
MNTFYFLRHGETVKDPSLPATEWNLTSETIRDLNNLAETGIFSQVTAIYSSHEIKSIRSAEPIAIKQNLKSIVIDGIEEVHRGEKFLTDREFQLLKREKLENRESNQDGGESSNMALGRFIATLNLIDSNHQNEHILIVSHGTILALYFSYLKDDFSDIYNYWNSIPFCAVGIVSDGSLEKDLTDY